MFSPVIVHKANWSYLPPAELQVQRRGTAQVHRDFGSVLQKGWEQKYTSRQQCFYIHNRYSIKLHQNKTAAQQLKASESNSLNWAEEVILCPAESAGGV